MIPWARIHSAGLRCDANESLTPTAITVFVLVARRNVAQGARLMPFSGSGMNEQRVDGRGAAEDSLGDLGPDETAGVVGDDETMGPVCYCPSVVVDVAYVESDKAMRSQVGDEKQGHGGG